MRLFPFIAVFALTAALASPSVLAQTSPATPTVPPASAQPTTAPLAAAQPTAVPAPTGPVKQLTLTEAVQLALEQNVNIQVQRINPRLQDENIALARSYYRPTATSDLTYNNTQTPPDTFLSGSQGTLDTGYFQGTVGVGQYLPWGGGNYSIGWDGSHYTSNSVFTNFDPRLRSNLTMSVTQPVFKNFSVDSARTQLVVSRRNRDISEIDLRGVVVQTIRNVKSAYWDLKYALANLQVQQQSLDLARQTLKDNRTRVEVGTMAPIDIVEAEAEVARNEESVIVAESNIKAAEDRLRALIFDPSTPGFWTMTLDPVDSPEMQGPPIDLEAAVRSALDKRTDLRSARASTENTAENIKYFRNQTLPQVDFQLNFQTMGLGGTQFLRGEGFPGPVIGEVDRPFSTVLSDVFKAAYPTWTAGLTLSYPLGQSAAKANLARTRLEQNQNLLQIKNLELQIGTQVRDVARQANTNQKRIEATRAARVLADRRLEAEQKKFAVGMSTSFLVFQAQRDLATARVNELQAILDYNKSLADYEAVQEASISGGGVSIASGGSALSTSVGATTAAAATRQQ